MFYPLYFYWRHGQAVSHRSVYERVVESLPIHASSLPQDELRRHVGHTVDSEVDILLEDADYFAFLEVKEPVAGRKIKFEKKSGVHQLVNQYVQGRIIEKMISKRFILATIGANHGDRLEIRLTPAERALLGWVGEDKETLSIVDLKWPSPWPA